MNEYRLLSFFIKNFYNKKLCRKVYLFLKDINFLAKDKSISREWFALTEYFLFDERLHANNYPKPELFIKDIVALESRVEGLPLDEREKQNVTLSEDQVKKCLAIFVKYKYHKEICKDFYMIIHPFEKAIVHTLSQDKKLLNAWDLFIEYILFDYRSLYEDFNILYVPLFEVEYLKKYISK